MSTEILKDGLEQLDPASLTLNEINNNGETVATYNSNLYIVGSDAGVTYKGEKSFAGAFTDNPGMMLAIYERGPTALDDDDFAQGASATMVATTSATIGLSQQYQTLAYSKTIGVTADKQIELDFSHKRTDIDPTDIDLSQSHVETRLDLENQNSFRKILEVGNADLFSGYTQTHAYRIVPKIKAVYDQIGLTVPDRDQLGNTSKMQVPTPAKFLDKMNLLREDPTLTVDIPPVKFIHEGAISASEYVRTFAEGDFPIGVGDFYYYMHDIGSEHLAALLLYGAPLMDLMSRFASATEELETVHFSHDLDDGLNGDLSGADKVSAASQRLDTITTNMGYTYLELSDFERHLGKRSVDLVGDFVSAIREAGKLEDSIIAHAILDRGDVKNLDDIAGIDVITELVNLAREKFDIDVEVREEPNFSGPLF